MVAPPSSPCGADWTRWPAGSDIPENFLGAARESSHDSDGSDRPAGQWAHDRTRMWPPETLLSSKADYESFSRCLQTRPRLRHALQTRLSQKPRKVCCDTQDGHSAKPEVGTPSRKISFDLVSSVFADRKHGNLPSPSSSRSGRLS